MLTNARLRTVKPMARLHRFSADNPERAGSLRNLCMPPLTK